MTTVDIQFSPAETEWPALRDAAQAADEGPFGAIWVFDHLAGTALGGSTMIESFTLLGALATVTQRVELGTMVANVWNRQVGTLLSAAGSVARVAGRQFHLGIGAGASPTSRWAIEQHAVGAHVEASLRERHDRVRQVLELSARMWHSDPAPELATFPAPTPPPTRIVGVNSVALSRLAGECADGINLPWRHPRRDEFLAAVNAVVGDRPFVRTVYAVYDDALLDPDHRDRRLMRERDIDRVVLAQFGRPQLPI